MAVNLIDSTDIEVTQTGNNIQLSTTVDMQALESNVSTNTSNISTNATDIENLQTYSTSEVNTGKVWINNKPIYRKVFIGTTSSSTTYNIISTEINSSSCLIINSYGSIFSQSGESITINSYSNANWYSGIYYRNTDTQLLFSDSAKGKNYYVVLEYTKTTD